MTETSTPRIRSERPAFDLHHPEAADTDAPVADKGVMDRLAGTSDLRGQDEHGELGDRGEDPGTSRGPA